MLSLAECWAVAANFGRLARTGTDPRCGERRIHIGSQIKTSVFRDNSGLAITILICNADHSAIRKGFLDKAAGETLPRPYINRICRCGRALYLNSDRCQLVFSVDNMNAHVSGREFLALLKP
jgi:hypothetical protein